MIPGKVCVVCARPIEGRFYKLWQSVDGKMHCAHDIMPLYQRAYTIESEESRFKQAKVITPRRDNESKQK